MYPRNRYPVAGRDAEYIVRGLTSGFRLGYSGGVQQQRPRNLGSARQHPEEVDRYIAGEARLQRVVCVPPGALGEITTLRISPIGVISKRSSPDKWRLIVHLSAPEDTSVNEGIEASLCSIKYISVDNAVRIIKQLGPRTMLAKLDLKEAYRMVPVHPQDRVLLGMHWKGETYVDAALPFGLRSAPKIFSALADALAWIIHANGFPNVLHYLEDYLLLGQPGTQRCTEALVRTLALCGELGVPLAEDKTEGPATSITFLGIEIDTEAFELRLPQHKLREMKSKLELAVSDICSSHT